MAKFFYQICKVALICVFCVLTYLYLYSNIRKRLSGQWVVEMDYVHMPYPDYTLAEALRNFSREREDLMFPIITLVTTFKLNRGKYVCHNNTLRNWNSLKPYVYPILYTDEEYVRNEAIEKGWKVRPIQAKEEKFGIPFLRHMYTDAMNVSNSTFYAYANADILFSDTLLFSLQAFLQSTFRKDIPALIVGRRMNVEFMTEKEALTWHSIHNTTRKRGQIFSQDAEDYFITSRNYPWTAMPDVVIGRVGYDNWLVLNSKHVGYITIDATNTLLAVHQTTIAGNHEGVTHNASDYNLDLLAKQYNVTKYENGTTSSTEFYTNFNKNGRIIFQKRD